MFESGDTIPANQTAVMDAKAVRDYLNTKTTPAGGWAGWRQFDPQHEAANDTPIMKALWQSVKPHITTIPCLVVEVNGKAEIVPFPKTPAEALAVLTDVLARLKELLPKAEVEHIGATSVPGGAARRQARHGNQSRHVASKQK